MMQNYKIAGLLVQMDTFGRTLAQAEDYRTDEVGDPDITINSHPQEFMQAHPNMDLDSSEYLSSGGSFYRQLLRFNGMMIHASAVVVDGFAYLFSAPCGTGKSTHTRMWRRAFGKEKVIMLNDDKPAVRREDGRWYAYGTPWSGKTAQNKNIRVPLGGVCMLSRGTENEIVPFTGAMAAFALLEQTCRPKSAPFRARLLELLDDLITQVPVWQLHCTPTVAAAKLSHSVMSAEANRRWPEVCPTEERKDNDEN